MYKYVVIVIIFIAVIFGCGEDNKDPISVNSTQIEAPKTGVIPLDEPVEQPQEPKNIIDILKGKAVKIGILVEAESDISPLYGAQLAMFEINQSGGVLGVPVDEANNQSHIIQPQIVPQEAMIGGLFGSPIALVARDNKDDPLLAEKLAKDLITKENVTAIIGPNYSYSALRVAPIAQQYRVPLVTTGATNPNITFSGEYVFMAAFDDTFQGKILASFARDTLKALTAATLIDRKDPYAVGLAKYFEENFISLGGKIVAKETYLQGDKDFETQLTTIADASPNVILLPGFEPEVSLVIEQSRKIPQKNATGITATFLGGDSWDEPELLYSDRIKILEGSYFSTGFFPETSDESGRAFTQSYKSMFGQTPNDLAAMGYDALKLVATAIRRANSTDRLAIRNQIAQTQNYDGATYIRHFDEKRHPIKDAVILQIKGGKAKVSKIVEP